MMLHPDVTDYYKNAFTYECARDTFCRCSGEPGQEPALELAMVRVSKFQGIDRDLQPLPLVMFTRPRHDFNVFADLDDRAR